MRKEPGILPARDVLWMATRGGARTCFFSPDLNQLYLAVPQRSGQDAEIRIYRPE